MPVDEKRRLEELKAEIRQIGNLVVWSENDLKLAIEVASSKTNLTNLALDQILVYEQLKFDRTSEILFEFKSFIPLVHDDLKAVAESSISSSSSIKETIGSSNENLLNGLESLNNKSMLAKAAEGGREIGALGSVSGSLAVLEALPIVNKIEKFLDAATLFLKSWSSPFNVGLALAIPIVGGLAVAFAGYYLIFSKLTDAVISISHDVRDVARGGLSGLIFGSDSSEASSSSENISSEDSTAIIGSIESTREAIDSRLYSLNNTSTEILNTATSILSRMEEGNRLLRSSILSSAAITNGMNVLKDVLFGSSRGEESSETSTTSVIYDTEFQNDLITLLRSTLSVRVENLPKVSENQEKPAEVFANAIKPITANQEALFKSLDSGLRRLNESVISLREANTDSRVSLLSQPIDSTDARISDNSEQYLLEATRDILTEVRRFYTSFEEYKTMLSGKSDIKTDNRNTQNPAVSGA
jgi:hypothetical protein